MTNMINMLVIADMHVSNDPAEIKASSGRKTGLALELLHRVLHEAKGSGIDVIILMGDLINNSNGKTAGEDMGRILGELEESMIPWIVVPGNHDPKPEIMFDIFKDYEGIHNINGYHIINFADSYDEKDKALRSWQKMEYFIQDAKDKGPVIYSSA